MKKSERGQAPFWKGAWPLFDVILFDIDNVLIDTRASYLAAIQKTVELYLNRPGIVSLKEIDQFKLLGGFNDDWDSCYGIITLLQTVRRSPHPCLPRRQAGLTGRRASLSLRERVRVREKRSQNFSISEFSSLFPERPLGMEGLLKHLRILYERAETPSYKKISRIFQEVYWGKKGLGLIRKEKLVFPKSLLEKIRKQGIGLGIVTGRNRFEARYALKRFGILNLFDVLVTIDDVKREEKRQGKLLRKPNPWPLLEAVKRFPLTLPSPPKGERVKGEGFRFLYVGDLPDDILAAKRARKQIRIRSAAFPKFTRDSQTALKELRKLKPDYLLKSPRDLYRLLS